MNYKDIIQKYLKEVPLQMELINKEYEKITDTQEHKDKMDDLKKYEERMIAGLNFLSNLDDKKVIFAIESIRNHPRNLLNSNKKRYLSALKTHREQIGLNVSDDEINNLISELKKIPLIHTTKNPDAIKKHGIAPGSELWLSTNKSCANAMDIVLGLDKPVFLTHGFHLKNFSNEFVEINRKLIDLPDTLISSLDLFTFVLIKTNKSAPCAIQTKEWIVALEDYSKNLFMGKDFWEIKAQYILTFFKSVDEYSNFAMSHYYENFIDKAPKNEYPFLGEIKVFGKIPPKQIIG